MAVVINEVATRGPGKQPLIPASRAIDEFMEILNTPGSAPADISDWQLRVLDSASNPVFTVIIPRPTVLNGGRRWLVANQDGYTGAVTPNQVYPTAQDFPDPGGVRLLDAAGAVVNTVGFSPGAPHEGLPAEPQDPALDALALSNQRVPDGKDTNNNREDFKQRPRTPGLVNAPA